MVLTLWVLCFPLERTSTLEILTRQTFLLGPSVHQHQLWRSTHYQHFQRPFQLLHRLVLSSCSGHTLQSSTLIVPSKKSRTLTGSVKFYKRSFISIDILHEDTNDRVHTKSRVLPDQNWNYLSQRLGYVQKSRKQRVCRTPTALSSCLLSTCYSLTNKTTIIKFSGAKLYTYNAAKLILPMVRPRVRCRKMVNKICPNCSEPVNTHCMLINCNVRML